MNVCSTTFEDTNDITDYFVFKQHIFIMNICYLEISLHMKILPQNSFYTRLLFLLILFTAQHFSKTDKSSTVNADWVTLEGKRYANIPIFATLYSKKFYSSFPDSRSIDFTCTMINLGSKIYLICLWNST